MKISFTNAIATIKDGCVIDEAKLRNVKVYGKLMLKAGMKFTDVKSVKDFILSESGEFIRSELFWVNSNGQMIFDDRLWLNVARESKIMRHDSTKMFFVELIHPTVDLSTAVEAFPK